MGLWDCGFVFLCLWFVGLWFCWFVRVSMCMRARVLLGFDAFVCFGASRVRAWLLC